MIAGNRRQSVVGVPERLAVRAVRLAQEPPVVVVVAHGQAREDESTAGLRARRLELDRPRVIPLRLLGVPQRLISRAAPDVGVGAPRVQGHRSVVVGQGELSGSSHQVDTATAKIAGE